MRLKRLRGLDEFPASSGERFQGSLLQTEFTFSVPRGGSRIRVLWVDFKILSPPDDEQHETLGRDKIL